VTKESYARQLLTEASTRERSSRPGEKIHLSAAIRISIEIDVGGIMPNPGQPTIKIGASGPVVKRLQRALRRTPNLGLVVDGVFGAQLEATVKDFQQGAGLTVDGVVGPLTWAALPDGGPMPTLQEGSSGKVVESLQRLLSTGATEWGVTPGAIDGIFGPHTKASVMAFQKWGGVTQDGIVGDQTWDVSLHAASSTLETAVGLNFVIG
jgi:peptidoglycan hydrolase-like protein with peptidoglycan-binding domain